MAGRLTALFSVGLWLLLTYKTFAHDAASTGAVDTPIRLTVECKRAPECKLADKPILAYSTTVVKEGVLLGALDRLQKSEQDFKYHVTVNPNYGLFLESVNGVAGSNQTYWELLSEKEGEYNWLNMGIGCYTPEADEHIILRLSEWSP